jgi:transcriptional regulator with XRE-family HTH domain
LYLHDYLILAMAFSLGKRLKATREALGLTQEQVIEQLENRYGVILSQQALSYIEHGKRKVEAERELPAFAGVYGKPIDYFYETAELFTKPVSPPIPKRRSLVTVDLEALTHRDKLELAVELINNILQET